MSEVEKHQSPDQPGGCAACHDASCPICNDYDPDAPRTAHVQTVLDLFCALTDVSEEEAVARLLDAHEHHAKEAVDEVMKGLE